jgi:hypothetical protein
MQARLPRGVLDGATLEPTLRFNEDLTTRPAWLLPHSGDPRLAQACWWTAQNNQASPGMSLHMAITALPTPYELSL